MWVDRAGSERIVSDPFRPGKSRPGRFERDTEILLNDLEIARSVPLRPLSEAARVLGPGEGDLDPSGRTMAKVRLDRLERPEDRPRAKYIIAYRAGESSQ